MDEVTVLEVGRNALVVILKISGPIMLVGLLVGVIIALFQALTTIQEMTLTFVPKLVVMVLLLLFLGKWIAVNMMSYTATIFERVATIAG